jgi:antitoxin VapB
MEKPMGMNIKSERAQKLAKEVAAQTGETMTAAVENALQERLERLLRDKDFTERKRRVRAIVKSFGPVPEGLTSDHSDLYDEKGLFK